MPRSVLALVEASLRALRIKAAALLRVIVTRTLGAPQALEQRGDARTRRHEQQVVDALVHVPSGSLALGGDADGVVGTRPRCRVGREERQVYSAEDEPRVAEHACRPDDAGCLVFEERDHRSYAHPLVRWGRAERRLCGQACAERAEQLLRGRTAAHAVVDGHEKVSAAALASLEPRGELQVRSDSVHLPCERVGRTAPTEGFASHQERHWARAAGGRWRHLKRRRVGGGDDRITRSAHGRLCRRQRNVLLPADAQAWAHVALVARVAFPTLVAARVFEASDALLEAGGCGCPEGFEARGAGFRGPRGRQFHVVRAQERRADAAT